MNDTKEKILDVAQRLFTVKGYDKVTLREIADEVGVTKAALYYYFDSKEKLLETLVLPFVEIQDRFFGLLETVPTRESWAKGLVALVEWAVPHRNLFELVQANQPALEHVMRNPEAAERHAEIHRKTDELLTSWTGSLEDKVRMVGATGFVWMVLAFPVGGAFGDAPADQLVAIVTDGIYDILQLERPCLTPST